jgi:hypothetical protein
MYKFFITILLVFSSLIPSFAFAGSDRDEYWLQRDIQIGDARNQYGKKVYGKAARAVMEDIPLANGTGSSVEQMIKRSIAADKPTAAKVGSSMLKRIYSPQAIVGTAAVTGLLTAIGWVMEDGIFVKKINKIDQSDCTTDTQCEWEWGWNLKVYPTAKAASDAFLSYENSKQTTFKYQYVSITLNHYSEKSMSALLNFSVHNVSTNQKWNDSFQFQATLNPKYDPKPPKVTTVPLTAALLGAAMLGSQYTDPDPNFDNDTVNTGDYTGVKETYEHDPSGVGNEVADDMDDKLKNAKPTDDGKSSYVGDPKYDDKPLSDGDDSSDRSWDEKGDEATGGTEPTKDPETGQATGGQSISLQFPLFCSWASKMCLWYDDWKSSDKVHQKFEEDVKNHQKDEKSFWQTVKDWFDWSKKDDDLPERDETDLITELPIEQKTKNINWSAQCPTAQSVPINFHGVTAEITVADFSYLCSLDWLIKPFVLAFASISAAFIVFGFNRGGDDG